MGVAGLVAACGDRGDGEGPALDARGLDRDLEALAREDASPEEEPAAADARRPEHGLCGSDARGAAAVALPDGLGLGGRLHLALREERAGGDLDPDPQLPELRVEARREVLRHGEGPGLQLPGENGEHEGGPLLPSRPGAARLLGARL